MTTKKKAEKVNIIEKEPSLERQRVNQKFDPELLIEEETIIEAPELNEIKKLFVELDADKDSLISFKEVQGLFEKFGKLDKKEQENVKNIFNKITSETEEKLINEEKLLTIYKSILKQRESDAQAKSVMEAFKMFDRDKNGVISAEEMKYILASLGEEYSDKEVDEVFNEADLNKDGNIDYEEFVQFWRNNFD